MNYNDISQGSMVGYLQSETTPMKKKKAGRSSKSKSVAKLLDLEPDEPIVLPKGLKYLNA